MGSFNENVKIFKLQKTSNDASLFNGLRLNQMTTFDKPKGTEYDSWWGNPAFGP